MTTDIVSYVLRDAMDRHAHAGRIALEGAGWRISYDELRCSIDRAAAAIQGWLEAHGQPVGILAPRGVSPIVAFLGAMQAGACACLIEPGLSSEVLATRMQSVGMRDLMVAPDVIEDMSALASVGIRLRDLTSDDTGPFRTTHLESYDRAMMLFTSGSTGQPKGVVLSHANLVSNARGVITHTGITPDDRLLHVMPLFHTNGINNQIIAPFLVGATVILADRFVAEEAVSQIETMRPTYMTGVPTIYARMLPHITSQSALSSLRFIRCGSAPITVALHEEIEAAFGIPLLVSYGLSEATCTSTMNPPHARRIGSIGTVLDGQQVKLFAPGTTQEVTEGTEGEICIGGPSLMLGYFGSDAQSPIKDGWLRTGDLGQFDTDGYLSITGRIKDVIIRGGENLSPQLIENVLVTHEAVGHCCVVGGPHRDLGEVPVAFIVSRTDTQPSVEDLRAHVTARLSRMYVPTEFHFLTALPENGVGKIDRKSLTSLLAK